MRLILANPHVHYYGKTVRNFLLNNRHVVKYPFVIDYYMKDKQKDIAILIDGTRSSLNELGIRFKLYPYFFSYLEFILWCFLNGLNPLRFKIFFNTEELNPKNDIILNFSFTTLDAFPRNNEHVVFCKYKGLIFTHLTHYLRNTEMIAENISKISNSILVAENNLVRNIYFKHFFSTIKRVYQLPFCFHNRFKNIKPFSERINKCFAVGACSDLGPEYETFFGKKPSFHPMRRTIYEAASEISSCIDSYISNFDDARKLNEIKPNDSLLTKWSKKHLPYFILVKIIPNFFTRYYKFNIVEKFNTYRMFISPEEVFGLPSINVFEGMACGSGLIAIDDPMYRNLGLIPGTHYITYKENNLDDLLATIKYYQNNPEELKVISQNGCDYVRKHFNEKVVAELFWKDLDYFSRKFDQRDLVFQCSFNI